MSLPKLTLLLYMGFMSGMQWHTVRVWSSQHNAYVYHSLLSAGYTKPLVRGLVQASKRGEDGIPNLHKDTISDFFAILWNNAADNVQHCKDMGPMQFFAACKAMVPRAATIPDEEFYQFTLRAIHARNIFKEYQPGWKNSAGTSMSQAIDNFCDAFHKVYDIKYGLEEMEKPQRERDMDKVKEIMAVRGQALKVRNMYFPTPLVCAEYQGDGNNKLFIDREYTNTMEVRAAAAASANEDRNTDMMDQDGNVNPYWQPLWGGDYDEEEEEQHDWRQLPTAESDDEADDDNEYWEETIGEEESGDEEDVTMRDPQDVENDVEIGGMAANLQLNQ